MMVCNHCTMDRRGMMMFRTSNGYVCNQCREEIKYAQAYLPTPEDELDDVAASPQARDSTPGRE